MNGIGGIYIRKLRFMLAMLLLLIVEAAAVMGETSYLRKHAQTYQVRFVKESSDVFRAQQVSDTSIKRLRKISQKQDIPIEQLLAVFMPLNNFCLEKKSEACIQAGEWQKAQQYLLKNHKSEYEELVILYSKIWQDIQYFPVPVSSINPGATVAFEDSWMYERNYGGRRGHEGCDIMAGINKRGYYPVVSMTDGIVEQIGWLEKGGYRIGIRSPHGGYYYYAHLYDYAQKYQTGDSICAGQLLGYMGDSGYGKEGTVGQFAVHLHVGIYIAGEDGEEISVNPYPVLKYFQENTVQYTY